MSRIINILTIDVEDYFQVENFKSYISYSDWDSYQCRVEKNTRLILKLLEKYEIKATFFVLGWLAERYPDLVKEIYTQGHEVATHGYKHTLIYKQTPKEFKDDLIKSIGIIQDVIKEPVLGYRAPAFSIREESLWALDIIKEVGLVYDASISPTEGHDRYGLKGSDPFIHRLNNGLYEFPQSTISFLGRRYSVLGGGYFRFLPYLMSKYFIRRINIKDQKPVIMYIHPWEFDPQQPVIQGINLKAHFRHYLNLNKTRERFEKMLSDFNFTSIKGYLEVNYK